MPSFSEQNFARDSAIGLLSTVCVTPMVICSVAFDRSSSSCISKLCKPSIFLAVCTIISPSFVTINFPLLRSKIFTPNSSSSAFICSVTAV